MVAEIRVLHFAETIRGGVATVVRQLMAAQLQDPQIQACAALVPAEHAADLVGVPAGHIHTFERSGRNTVSLLNFVKAAWRLMKLKQPNVVHLHSTFAGVLLRPMVLLLPKHQRPKVVYCPHAWAFMMAGHPFKKWFYATIERLLLPLTDTVICVSEYERELARKFGLSTAKMVVIYNGVPVPSMPMNPKKVTENQPIKALFVGRLDRQKGFDVLYAAMAQVPVKSVVLKVIGEAVHGSQALTHMPNITSCGWQTPAQVTVAMQEADVLIMPSRWEGFAMVPLEAMANGCAVIASDVCSLPEVVEDGITGYLIPPDNANALAHLLMTTKAQAWHAMGQAGQQRVQQKFTLSAMTGATLQVYLGNLGNALVKT